MLQQASAAYSCGNSSRFARDSLFTFGKAPFDHSPGTSHRLVRTMVGEKTRSMTQDHYAQRM